MILTIEKRANAVWFISCFCLKFYVDYEMQIWNTDLEADVNINATKIMSTYLRQFLMWISIFRFFSALVIAVSSHARISLRIPI